MKTFRKVLSLSRVLTKLDALAHGFLIMLLACGGLGFVSNPTKGQLQPFMKKKNRF